MEGYANIIVRRKQVPIGHCELDANIKSYSGYADIAPDQHIFFWFFEARNADPTEACCAAMTLTFLRGGENSDWEFRWKGLCDKTALGRLWVCSDRLYREGRMKYRQMDDIVQTVEVMRSSMAVIGILFEGDFGDGFIVVSGFLSNFHVSAPSSKVKT
jgi:hypothetical protein